VSGAVSVGAQWIMGEVGGGFSILAWFLRRLVRQSDDRHAENRKAIESVDRKMDRRLSQQDLALTETAKALAVIVAEFKPVSDSVGRMDMRQQSLSEAISGLTSTVEAHQRWIDLQSHPAMLGAGMQRPRPNYQ